MAIIYCRLQQQVLYTDSWKHRKTGNALILQAVMSFVIRQPYIEIVLKHTAHTALK